MLLAMPIVSFARTDSADARRLPGFIDGAFGDLAGEDDEVVEVNLGPSLLGAIARGASKDQEAKSVLDGLRSVTAYILTLKGDPGRAARAGKLVKEMEAQLEAKG